MKVIEIDALISALNKKPQTKNYMMRVSDVYNVIRSVPVYDIDPTVAPDHSPEEFRYWIDYIVHDLGEEEDIKNCVLSLMCHMLKQLGYGEGIEEFYKEFEGLRYGDD